MTFEEADNRLVAGWHVELPEADVLASAQRKRYLRLDRERLLTSVDISINTVHELQMFTLFARLSYFDERFIKDFQPRT